ncbi:MFS general substrate transporter [Thozetella sp. PMI_491]|nr:MFS general substrate transporter [Thozetella sp. PMI_491]
MAQEKQQGSCAENEGHAQQTENIDENSSSQTSAAAKFTYWDWQFLGVFLSIAFGFYAAFLGTLPSWNQITTSSGYVQTDLGPAEVGSLNWAWPNLLFSQTLSSILFGRLSDFIGRRWIFVCGNIVSAVGFIACGRSSDGRTISGLNVLIGVGSGIQIMGPFLALAELVPVKHRFAVVGICISLFTPVIAMAPAIAGALSLHTTDSWRWCYSINAILSLVSAVGLFALYHPPTYKQFHEHLAANEEPTKLDWIGLIVMSTSSGFFAYLLVIGRTIWDWQSPQMIVLVTAAGLAMVLYMTYQYYWGTDHEALPAYLLRNWPTLATILHAAAASLILWFMPFASVLLYQSIFTEMGMKASWYNSLFTAGLNGGFLLASFLSFRPKNLKWHQVASTAIFATFLACLSTAKPGKLVFTNTCAALLGIGSGYSILISYIAVPLTGRHRDIGLLAGLVSGYRTLCFSLFYALFASIFFPRVQDRMQQFVSSAAVQGGLPLTSLPALFGALDNYLDTQDPSGLLTVPGISTQILLGVFDAVIQAFVNAWRFVVLLATSYCVIMPSYYTWAVPQSAWTKRTLL